MNNNNLQENKKQAVFDIELSKIKPNPFQPRIYFDESQLESLANSIRQYGVLQPIVVSKKETYQEGVGITSEYEIIAGERRFRASKLAGLERIPAIIRENDHTDAEKLELAIIENLQREDLNPIDKARAFRKLADEFDMRHADIAIKLGKSREYVSNSLRLLTLPAEIQEAVITKRISEGHAKPLLMLKDRPQEQMELFKRIITNKLTVRSAERIAREIAVERARKFDAIDPEIKAAERKLSEKLGTKVYIEQKKEGGAGKITIEYFSKEDLDTILLAIKEKEAGGEMSGVFSQSQQEEKDTLEHKKKGAIEEPNVLQEETNSLYDSFLASKKEIEQRNNFIENEHRPVDKSIGEEISGMDDVSFSLSKETTFQSDPTISDGTHDYSEEVEISSVMTGTDFLAARNFIEVDEKEEKDLMDEQKNHNSDKDNYDFKNFSI